MLWLRACSKCGGDLFRDWDDEVPIISCLKCGHILTASEETSYVASLANACQPAPDVMEAAQAYDAA